MACILLPYVMRALGKLVLTTEVKHFSRGSSFLQNDKCTSSFGICFDIDGVIARGHIPFKESVEAFKLLKDPRTGDFKYPVAFVSNALYKHSWKAEQLSSWLKTKVEASQMVMAQSPLEVYTSLQKKHCLLIGQGPLKDIAADLGLENVCTIEDVTMAYPLLDVAHHDLRKIVAETDYSDTPFPQIETIIIMGEPKHWETPLQVLIDILLTNGKPARSSHRTYTQTVPVIACNHDLQFMHKAAFPRFGNGAFLHCLEALFKKMTNKHLKYSDLLGKPSEVTFRFAEHCLARENERIGLEANGLRTIYMIGDNPEVDIVGANLYQRYLDTYSKLMGKYQVPEARLPPPTAKLLPKTATTCRGILVRTGVYLGENTDEFVDHSHRDFLVDEELLRPHVIVDNILDAVQYILQEQEDACELMDKCYNRVRSAATELQHS